MHDLPLISTLAMAFTTAWLLGLITQKLKLSPIVGYLLAGVVISPHTPGIVADVQLANQLAEIGVILLMFGVGLHFHLKDLLAVRNVAIPGAIGQSVIATLLALVVAAAFGWPTKSGLVLGMAMSVASTVVLMRVLMDNRLFDTTHGHVAVGWLIVEDLLTVIVLVLIPSLGAASDPLTAGSMGSLAWALGIALAKLAAMVGIILWGGAKIVPWIMVQVTRLRSRELFTLTVLMMAITVAAGSAYLFGASMALGAFLAGMVVGQSSISQQAAADAMPLRDAFAVLFFTSVGMLFDPMFVVREPWLTLACLAVVMIGKPLAAMALVAIVGYPVRTALVVALGLAQIGEFSFILSGLARQHGLLGDAGHNVLVACAILSITLNPLLFRAMPGIESILHRRPWLWHLLSRRAEKKGRAINQRVRESVASSEQSLAVILGYGPVGRTVDELLRNRGMDTVVVDLNMDTIQNLTRQGRKAIYGDAYNIEVIGHAVARATHLVITLPHADNRATLIAAARRMNAEMKVFVRARYIGDRAELIQVGADEACYEEAEAAVALARLVLRDCEETSETIEAETDRIRRRYDMSNAV
ncbi:MAG: cation:proton antiporter [Phycisphaeraceae bacterium]|nr:cation:proton antiporter [Phycisphaeraceae bacterium]